MGLHTYAYTHKSHTDTCTRIILGKSRSTSGRPTRKRAPPRACVRTTYANMHMGLARDEAWAVTHVARHPHESYPKREPYLYLSLPLYVRIDVHTHGHVHKHIHLSPKPHRRRAWPTLNCEPLPLRYVYVHAPTHV